MKNTKTKTIIETSILLKPVYDTYNCARETRQYAAFVHVLSCTTLSKPSSMSSLASIDMIDVAYVLTSKKTTFNFNVFSCKLGVQALLCNYYFTTMKF